MFIDLFMCLVNGHSREYVQIFLDNKITLLVLVVYFRFFFVFATYHGCVLVATVHSLYALQQTTMVQVGPGFYCRDLLTPWPWPSTCIVDD